MERFAGRRAPAIRAGLAQLLLRSARAYPEPARRIIERAIALERRSEDVFETVVGFSQILAQTCPQLLADLVRAELFEKLPLEEIEEERASREAQVAQLKAIRAKPEAERSDSERRVLSSPALFTTLGRKSFGFEDVGLDRHHRWFFPPTPAHEPFASLFATAPDVARALVRDMSNRATKAWRQVYEINAGEQMATPCRSMLRFLGARNGSGARRDRMFGISAPGPRSPWRRRSWRSPIGPISASTPAMTPMS